MTESALTVKAVRAINKFGHDKKIFLERVRDNFLAKGTLGLWWDYKLSEEEKDTWWYFYLILIRWSDKRAVVNEIQKLIEFYKNLENVSSVAFEQSDLLHHEVKRFLRETERRMRTTRSKTVYDVCKELVSSNIESKIDKIKSAVGEKEFKKLRDKFDEILKGEVKNWKTELTAEIDTLKEINKIKGDEIKAMSEVCGQQIQEIDSRMSAIHCTLVDVLQCFSEEETYFKQDSGETLPKMANTLN